MFLPIFFAIVMASTDAISMALLKEYSLGAIPWRGILPLVMLLYSVQPIVFLQSLHYETMTVMNLLWDVISDVLVTVIGLCYFREKISSLKKVGLAFAFVAIVLLSYDTLEHDK